MSDAAPPGTSITQDAALRLRLRPEAVEHAKTRFGVRSDTAVAAKLDLTRMALYRLQNGVTDMRLSRAQVIANKLGWTIDATFGPVDRAA